MSGGGSVISEAHGHGIAISEGWVLVEALANMVSQPELPAHLEDGNSQYRNPGLVKEAEVLFYKALAAVPAKQAGVNEEFWRTSKDDTAVTFRTARGLKLPPLTRTVSSDCGPLPRGQCLWAQRFPQRQAAVLCLQRCG